MDAEATVRTYYDAFRNGRPIAPFFAREAMTVTFGIGDRLHGFTAIERGLTEQTATTDDWPVESDRLVVTERDDHAWFTDEVFVACYDLNREGRYEFGTRWSGTLLYRPHGACVDPASDPETRWRFVGMHVSTPGGTG